MGAWLPVVITPSYSAVTRCDRVRAGGKALGKVLSDQYGPYGLAPGARGFDAVPLWGEY